MVVVGSSEAPGERKHGEKAREVDVRRRNDDAFLNALAGLLGTAPWLISTGFCPYHRLRVRPRSAEDGQATITSIASFAPTFCVCVMRRTSGTAIRYPPTFSVLTSSSRRSKSRRTSYVEQVSRAAALPRP